MLTDAEVALVRHVDVELDRDLTVLGLRRHLRLEPLAMQSPVSFAPNTSMNSVTVALASSTDRSERSGRLLGEVEGEFLRGVGRVGGRGSDELVGLARRRLTGTHRHRDPRRSTAHRQPLARLRRRTLRLGVVIFVVVVLVVNGSPGLPASAVIRSLNASIAASRRSWSSDAAVASDVVPLTATCITTPWRRPIEASWLGR